MDERLVYLFEANRRKSIRLRRIAIALAVLLVLVICIAVILAAIVIQLKLESLVAKTTSSNNEINGSTVRPKRPTRIVFAINMIGKKNRRLKRAIDNTRRFTTSVIRSVMAKRNSDGTEFALQLYSIPQNTSFTFFANAYKTLKLLDTVMYSDFPFNNPNQTDAILQYRNEYGDSNAHPYRYYYILFAADPSTYRDSLFYERDMKDSNAVLSRISSAKTQAVVVGDERLFNMAYATVISNNQTIDEIISKINGHMSNADIDEYIMEKPSPSLKFYPSSVTTYNNVVPAAPTFENDGDDLLPPSHMDHTQPNGEPYVESSDEETNLPRVTISSDSSPIYEEPSNDDHISPTAGQNDPRKAFINISASSQGKEHTQRIAKPTYLAAIPSALPENDYSENSGIPPAVTAIPETKMGKTSKIMSSNLNKPLIAANRITSSHTTVTDSSRSSIKHFGTGKVDNVSGRESDLSSMSPRQDMEVSLNGFSTTGVHISRSLEGSSRAEITRHHTSSTSENQAILLSVRPAVRTSMREPPLRHRFRVTNTSTEASVTAPIWPPASMALPTTFSSNLFSHAVSTPSTIDGTVSHSESTVSNEESEVREQFSVVREPAEPPGETSYLGNVEDLKSNLRYGSSQKGIVSNPSLSERGETLSSSRRFLSSKAEEIEAASESFDGSVGSDTSMNNHASHSGDQSFQDTIEEGVHISPAASESDHVNGHHDFDPQVQNEDNRGISSLETDAMPESSTAFASTVVQTVTQGARHLHIPEKLGSAAPDNSPFPTTLPSGRESPSLRNLSETHSAQIVFERKGSFRSPGTSGTIISTIPETHKQERPDVDIESPAESSPDVEGNVGATLTSSEDRSSREESAVSYTSTTSMPESRGFDDFSLEFPDITSMVNANVREANPVEETESSGEPSSSREHDAESGMIGHSKEDLEDSDGANFPEYSKEHQSSEFAIAWSATSEPTLKTDRKKEHSRWVSQKTSTASGLQLTGGSGTSSAEKENPLEFDTTVGKGMRSDRFSVEAENGDAVITSISVPSPSGLLEVSRSPAVQSKYSKSTNQEIATLQHPKRLGNVNDNNSSDKSFSAVGGGQKHRHRTNEYITTTLSPGNQEQQFDGKNDEVLTSGGGLITEELNTSNGDGNEQSTEEPDHDGSFPIAAVNRNQRNQHDRKQAFVSDGVVSTPAVNSFSAVDEITSTTQPEQTTENTATVIVEHASVTIATPHIFEVSKAVEYSLENTGPFTAPALAISLVTETPSEIINEGVQSDSTANHDSKESSPSLNGESISSREEIAAQEGSIDVKGANEITFVNIPPTSGEFFEMVQTEPTEPLVNVENRRAFIEASHRTMRVWPSGKIFSETTFQNPATPSNLEEHRSTLQKGATVTRHESSTSDLYSHFIETTSQTSLLSFSDGTIDTSQGLLPDDMVIESVDKETISRNGERLDNRAQHVDSAHGGKKSSSVLTNSTSLYVSGRLSDGALHSADRTKFQTASSMSHSGKSVFDSAKISHSVDTTLATLVEHPTELIVSSTSQASPIAEPIRASEESRFDDGVRQDADRTSVNEQLSSGNDADRVVTQIMPTISTEVRFDGDGSDPDITATSIESIVDRSDDYHRSDIITSSLPPMNSDDHTASVTRNTESISQTAEYDHTRSMNSQQSTPETSERTNEAFRPSNLDIRHDELIRSNNRERILTDSSSASFGHSNMKFSESIDSRAIDNIAVDETIPAANDFERRAFTFDERTHGNVEDSENDAESSDSTLEKTTEKFTAKSSSLLEARVRTNVANISLGPITRKHARTKEKTTQTSKIMTSMEQSPQFGVRGSHATSASNEHNSEEVSETSVTITNSRTLDVFASSVSPPAKILEDFTGTSRRSPSVNVLERNSGASSSSVESLANSLSEMMLTERQDTFSGGITSTEQYSTVILSPKESVYPCVVDLIVAIDYEPTVTENRDKVAQFLRQIMNNWTLSDNAVRVAVVSYGLDDGVGIYSDSFGTSQLEVSEALRNSFESSGGGVGVVYPLSRLFEIVHTDYSLTRNFNRFDDESNRGENAIRNNTRVAYLIFSDSSNTTDIRDAAVNNVCNNVPYDCRVLTVGMKNAADLSPISHPVSATMKISNFTETSLDSLNSFIVRNMCN